MSRVAKIALWAPVLLLAAVLALAYSGVAEPTLMRGDIPVDPPVAFVGVFVAVFAAAIGTGLINRWAWKAAGNAVGLTVDGIGLRASPDMSGTVAGRQVTARTYSTGGNSGGNSSSETYTVVETDLDRPVEWWGTFASIDGGGTGHEQVGGMDSFTVDGEVSVRGDVDEAIARQVLTPAVTSALESVDGGVAVGDVEQQVVAAMQSELAATEGGMGATIAAGMLRMASDGEPAGPSETVGHRDSGVVRDQAELQRRIDAVTAVADAVEHHASR